MYCNRVKMTTDQRSFYLITNRIVGGSFVLGDVEKEKLRHLMFAGTERLSYRIWDYVIMGNHYHAVIEIPEANAMARDELIERWQRYYRLPSLVDPGDDALEGFRQRIHNVSLAVSNFQQRFTQWYNKRNGRWGRLFGGRFDSVIVDRYGSLAKMMAYVTLNPVRAEIVADPAEYRWCGYGERMAKGRLQEENTELPALLAHELGLSTVEVDGNEATVMNVLWTRFRAYLLGHTADRSGIDRRQVADVLNKENRALALTWSQRLMLKVRFASKGVAVGSKEFVEDVLRQHGAALGYKREHRPEEARAWDETYCLRKHQRWIG